jgi:hypothetical protein
VDGSQFDDLVRVLAVGSPRREALHVLVGGALGLLGWLSLDKAAAHDLMAKCKKIKEKKKKKACAKKAKKHAAQHLSEGSSSSSSPDPCADVTCPAISNGTAACQNGACVVASCQNGFTRCGNACVNTQDDPQNCRKCGVVCPGTHPNRCVGGTCVQTFESFGTSWSYTAPAAGTVEVEVIGAQGGAGSASTAGSSGGAGGLGGKNTGSFTVTSQEILLIGVGEAGSNASGQTFGRGGVNGGGNGQNGQPGSGGGGGGGGGGASDVRRSALPASGPLVLAKGGGGGGGGGTGGGTGGIGAGGTAGGSAGQPGQNGSGFQLGQVGDGKVTVRFTPA